MVARNISGTICASPPRLITTMISTAIRPTFFSIASCAMSISPSGWLRNGDVARTIRRGLPGLVDVPDHEEHAAQEHDAAEQSERVIRLGALEHLDERIGQRAVVVERTPHQTLHQAGRPHRGDVKHRAYSRGPEMPFDGFYRVHLLDAPQ